jgi:hypothetical protein
MRLYGCCGLLHPSRLQRHSFENNTKKVFDKFNRSEDSDDDGGCGFGKVTVHLADRQICRDDSGGTDRNEVLYSSFPKYSR